MHYTTFEFTAGSLKNLFAIMSKESSCRGRHSVEIGGIQPEVIHHSGPVACTEADRTLEEGEHLRMFVLKRHPKDLVVF